MPTKGTGVVVVVAVVVAVVIAAAVFNGSDAAISAGIGSVVGTTMLLMLLCGTEIPMTALAVKWVLFAA